MRDTVIFDLDGTLALIDHRFHHIRGPEKDWSAFFRECDKDEPFETVLAVARALQLNGYKLWVVSGREEVARARTLAWLEALHINPEALLLRPAGNHAPEAKLKTDWIRGGHLPLERVMCVFEDRRSAIDVWCAANLTCFQVVAPTP